MASPLFKEKIITVVCEANIRLINGTFGKKEGEAFRKTLTEQLVNLPDDEEIIVFVFEQLESCCRLPYQRKDEPTYFGIIRYIFSALSLLEWICGFNDDESGKPSVEVFTTFTELLNKTVLELTKKIKATKSISQLRATMKEFHGIALEAYEKGFDAAAFFISSETNEFMSNCGDTVLIHDNPVAANLYILSLKSLDIVKHADFVLSNSKKVQFLPPNQKAQMLQLQAKAYHVKSIYSLAIQRGKEARDMYLNEIDKEKMKRFIEQMEIEQQEKKKDAKPEKNTEDKQGDSVDGVNKIDELDDHMEPILKETEEKIMKGTFDAPTAQHFHNELRKYITDMEQHDKQFLLPKGTLANIVMARICQGLQSMIKNLSEDEKVWFGLYRYLFHVISLNDSFCILDEDCNIGPRCGVRSDFNEIYYGCLSKIKNIYKLTRKTIEEVTVYCEELMDIARQAAKYGHKICCILMTNDIAALYTMNLSLIGIFAGSPTLREIWILHLESIDISKFPDYVIEICRTGPGFSPITRKHKGMFHEYYSQALKHKKRYEQAIQKAQEAKASFQDEEDKNRIDELIHELESLDLLSRT